MDLTLISLHELVNAAFRQHGGIGVTDIEILRGRNMKSDLEVLNEMVKANMDIVACPTMVHAQSNKRGGTISMGVPNPAFTDFALGSKKYIPILYLVNEEQFFDLKEK